MTRARATLAAVTCGAILLIPTMGMAATPTVKLAGQSFSPKTVSVKKGGKVTFKWRSGTHDVRFSKSSGVKNLGTRSSGSRSRTFKKKGSFKMVCTLHEGMTGKINVK